MLSAVLPEGRPLFEPHIVLVARLLALESLEGIITPRIAASPADVNGPHPVCALYFVAHLGALLERLGAATRHVRAAHEEVPSSIIGTDKTVAYRLVPQPERSFGHALKPPYVNLLTTPL